ncbi:MAG: hypothetical protein AAFV93_22305 [Chloroflexota bacterium]
MFDTIKKLWFRLTEPSPETIKPEDRHKQRLLNMLLLIFAPTSILLALFENLSVSEQSLFQKPDTMMILGLLVVILYIIYYFSRLLKQ